MNEKIVMKISPEIIHRIKEELKSTHRRVFLFEEILARDYQDLEIEVLMAIDRYNDNIVRFPSARFAGMKNHYPSELGDGQRTLKLSIADLERRPLPEGMDLEDRIDVYTFLRRALFSKKSDNHKT